LNIAWGESEVAYVSNAVGVFMGRDWMYCVALVGGDIVVLVVVVGCRVEELLLVGVRVEKDRNFLNSVVVGAL
jgi:hypothetical protein